MMVHADDTGTTALANTWTGETQIHLDTLPLIHAEVGYGSYGHGGRLGYEGKSVSVHGRHYVHALSAHAPARLIFNLDRSFSRFRCQVGFNDDVWQSASHCDFLVYADGRLACAPEHVVAGDPPRSVEADITGALELELSITTNSWEYCHSVWLDPVVDCIPIAATSASLFDCMRRTQITVPHLRPRGSRCIATVASASFAGLLDDLLGSLYANGCVPDALVVVFCVGDDVECRRICSKYGATLLPCAPAARLSVAVKALLYSVARVVDAEKFLCLDSDMLVLRDLRPVFAALDACPTDSILACREGNRADFRNLEHALTALYFGRSTDITRLLGTPKDEALYPLVVNDGLFAGTRTALLALDYVISRMSEAAAWVDENPNLTYRNQFVFNLALARLGCGVALDPRYNIQLHSQNVDLRWKNGQVEALWNGCSVRVLHFNGWGRQKYPEWRNLFAKVPDPLVGAGDGDCYSDFLVAIRTWVGRHGLSALAWSFYGTSDATTARVRDPSVMPLLALLHYLIRANGCIRVLETGTAKGVSSACLASAVAVRAGGRVVTFDPAPHPERLELWESLPWAVASCIEQRIEGSLEGMAAALAAEEQFEAALLDSIHSEDHIWAEFLLAAKLVCAGGLILIHDVRLEHGTVEQALQRIEGAGYGVTRLWTAEAGITEDDCLGLAVIENRKEARARQPGAVGCPSAGVTGWSEWADSLSSIFENYQRPSGAYGMTTDQELCFLENYGRYRYSGQGLIVDLGCWLGATTLSLARGLVDNPRHHDRRAIEAIDRFIWEDWMTPIGGWLGLPKIYQAGDSFLEDVQTLLHDYENLVHIQQQDLSYPQEFLSQVELLFIDAMKSWDLARTISRTFFPRLIPGVSLVVQQDFGYHDPIVATNHLLMWQLREYFQCLYCVPRSCSVVYLNIKQISLCDLPDLIPEAFTLEMIYEAWEHSLRSVTAELRPPVLMCKLLFLIERGEMEAAEPIARQLIAEGALVSSSAITQAQAAIACQQTSASTLARNLGKIAELVAILGDRLGL